MNGKDSIREKVDEYHLMIEEVLGGMDMMITKLDSRVKRLEEATGISGLQPTENIANQIKSLRTEISGIKSELKAGLDLAFRQITQK